MGCLLGYNAGTVTTSHASCATTATGSGNIVESGGGLVGRSDGVVSDSYATGEVRSDSRAAGLVGETVGGRISDSYATGNVSTGGLRRCRLVWWARAINGTRVTNSYATGDVHAGVAGNAGGLLGDWDLRPGDSDWQLRHRQCLHHRRRQAWAALVGRLNSGADVIGSYATGNVSATGNNSNLGGLVGWAE